MVEPVDFAHTSDHPEWESYVERGPIAPTISEGDVAKGIRMEFTLCGS